MIELDLLDELSARLEDLFAGYTLLNKAKVLQEVKIYKQYLPQSSGMTIGGTKGLGGYSDADYESNFPCIIVKYLDHTDKEERRIDQSMTNIKVLYGVYDDAPECQGYRDILNMIDTTRATLLQERIIGKQFLLNMPMKSRLLDGDTWPVYFGEIDLWFTTGRAIMGKDYIYKGAIRE